MRLTFRKSKSVPVEGGGEICYYAGHTYEVDAAAKPEFAAELTAFNQSSPDPIAWPEGEPLPTVGAPQLEPQAEE